MKRYLISALEKICTKLRGNPLLKLKSGILVGLFTASCVVAPTCYCTKSDNNNMSSQHTGKINVQRIKEIAKSATKVGIPIGLISALLYKTFCPNYIRVGVIGDQNLFQKYIDNSLRTSYISRSRECGNPDRRSFHIEIDDAQSVPTTERFPIMSGCYKLDFDFIDAQYALSNAQSKEIKKFIKNHDIIVNLLDFKSNVNNQECFEPLIVLVASIVPSKHQVCCLLPDSDQDRKGKSREIDLIRGYVADYAQREVLPRSSRMGQPTHIITSVDNLPFLLSCYRESVCGKSLYQLHNRHELATWVHYN